MSTLTPVNPDYRSPKLKTFDPLQLQDRPVPERKWIVPGWVPHGQTTMLTGDGGIGKTIAAMGLATACATGQPWFGQIAMHCKALAILCEDDEDEIHRRQDAINRFLGVEFADLENLQIIPRIGCDNALMIYENQWQPGEPTEFFQQIHDAAQDFGAQLIVLDSLHDLFAGNENSRIHARQFIQLLTSLARDCDGATFLCAHPSLDGLRTGSGTAGSTAWNNAVRSRLYLTHEDDDETGDRRVLHRMKANYASRGDLIKLTYRDGVFVADEAYSGVRGASRGRKAETVFLELLERFEADGRPVSEKSRASNYAPKLFGMRPERDGFEKRDFERAMEALFSQGRIKIDEYGRQGDPRRRLASVPMKGESHNGTDD
jgi:RecA-family ATPase